MVKKIVDGSIVSQATQERCLPSSFARSPSSSRKAIYTVHAHTQSPSKGKGLDLFNAGILGMDGRVNGNERDWTLVP